MSWTLRIYLKPKKYGRSEILKENENGRVNAWENQNLLLCLKNGDNQISLIFFSIQTRIYNTSTNSPKKKKNLSHFMGSKRTLKSVVDDASQMDSLLEPHTDLWKKNIGMKGNIELVARLELTPNFGRHWALMPPLMDVGLGGRLGDCIVVSFFHWCRL